MIVNKKVKQRSYYYVVVSASITVTVYAEVKVDGDHGVVDDPAE